MIASQVCLGPPTTEPERVAGTDQCESAEHDSVDEVLVHERIVGRWSEALHMSTNNTEPEMAAIRTPMPESNATPMQSRPIMKPQSASCEPDMLW